MRGTFEAASGHFSNRKSQVAYWGREAKRIHTPLFSTPKWCNVVNTNGEGKKTCRKNRERAEDAGFHQLPSGCV